MHIALDARTLYAPQRRGIGKSLLQLYRHLAQVRPDWRIIAYHRQPHAPPLPLPAGFAQPRRIEMPGDRFDAWLRWRLPWSAMRDGVDLLHCPANVCPAWMPVPTVVTVHDLIPLDLPHAHTPTHVERFRQSVRVACQRAAAVLCPSHYTRRRLIQDMGADPRRVHVVPWAGDELAPAPVTHQPSMLLGRYRVAPPYVLHLGAADPRKNTRGLIESWAALPTEHRGQWKLLIVGLDDATRRDLLRLCQQRGVSETVVLHGFVHEDELPALMASAQVLAYPSLSEGFGLPILEAYAQGVAVLAGNATSLPEVAGDAAVLVDPQDVRAIRNALARLMGDPSLRQALVQRGRLRLAGWTWRDCAQKFAQVLEEASCCLSQQAA